MNTETVVPQNMPLPKLTVVPDAPPSATPSRDDVRLDQELLPREPVARRILNVGVAAVALVLLLPVMLLVALAVRLTSRGPIFYTQTRVGLDRRVLRSEGPARRRREDIGGRPFTIYKFRSMTVDAEKHSGAVWATRNDPRITPIGRFLRQTRLDELPQLWNVLKGDMNIVGPRPERPAIFGQLADQVDSYRIRQRTKPGITGLAQINLNYDGNLDDVRRKVAYDLAYIRRQSFLTDLLIMVRTIPVMLFRRGAN